MRDTLKGGGQSWSGKTGQVHVLKLLYKEEQHMEITEWKKQLLEHAADVFSKDRKPEQSPGVTDLHAKIGRLSMENDFLSGALGRIGDASAKR